MLQQVYTQWIEKIKDKFVNNINREDKTKIM